MNLIARYNLQHNVPEDRSYEGTNYAPENALDKYILQKKQMLEQLAADQAEILLQRDIEKQIDQKLPAALDKILNDLFKPITT